MRTQRLIRWLSLSLLALSGCAGDPVLPRTQLDRPYTLPNGDRTFGGTAGWSFVRGGNSQDFGATGQLSGGRNPKSAYWGLALSDDWTLLIFPGVRYQLLHSEDDILGVQLSTGGAYTTSAGWDLTPFLSFYYRHKATANLGWEAFLSGTGCYPLSSGHPTGRRAELLVGPMFQLDETKALSLSSGLRIEKQFEASQQTFNSDTTPVPDPSTQYVAPVEAYFAWSLGKKWETSLEYDWAQLGYTSGYAMQTVAVGLSYYW